MTNRTRHYPKGALPGWTSHQTFQKDLFGRNRALVHRYIEYDVPGLLERTVNQYVVNQVTVLRSVLWGATAGHIRVQLRARLKEETTP